LKRRTHELSIDEVPAPAAVEEPITAALLVCENALLPPTHSNEQVKSKNIGIDNAGLPVNFLMFF
jgi:hypothetical protein